METFEIIMQVLLVLALVGLIGVLAWIAKAAITLKNEAMRNAKQLYLPPLNAVKNLTAAGKGLAYHETARVKRITAVGKRTIHAVSGDINGVKEAVHAIPVAETKTVLRNAKSLLKLVQTMSHLARSMSSEGSHTVS